MHKAKIAENTALRLCHPQKSIEEAAVNGYAKEVQASGFLTVMDEKSCVAIHHGQPQHLDPSNSERAETVSLASNRTQHRSQQPALGPGCQPNHRAGKFDFGVRSATDLFRQSYISRTVRHDACEFQRRITRQDMFNRRCRLASLRKLMAPAENVSWTELPLLGHIRYARARSEPLRDDRSTERL